MGEAECRSFEKDRVAKKKTMRRAHKLDELLGQYDYRFPKRLVAQEPVTPRDGARLMVVRRARSAVRHDQFRNLQRHLPPRSVIVFNKTRVVPARLFARRETGSAAQILYLRSDKRSVFALSNKRLPLGAKLSVGPKLFFVVRGRDGGVYSLQPSFAPSCIYSVLERYGKTPLPPYLKRTRLTEEEAREKYQTVFAREKGSIAAPTASLHFTPRLMRLLRVAGHEVCFVTLHVNLGTFAPLTESAIVEGKLHTERYEVPDETARVIRKARADGRRIIAVGTTVLRALESAVAGSGEFDQLSGETDIFIREGYRFRVVDGLITNFHVPRSSLMMLVAALVGRERLLELYRIAIANKYRLFSFGDGMLIL